VGILIFEFDIVIADKLAFYASASRKHSRVSVFQKVKQCVSDIYNLIGTPGEIRTPDPWFVGGHANNAIQVNQ